MNLKSKGNSFISSFMYAVKGIYSAFKSEKNLRVHSLLMIVVTISGFYFNISNTEWLIIVGVITLVVSSELMNTAIEAAVDLVTDKFHEKAEEAKDVAAGAVFVTAIGAAIIGMIIFLPKIF